MLGLQRFFSNVTNGARQTQEAVEPTSLLEGFAPAPVPLPLTSSAADVQPLGPVPLPGSLPGLLAGQQQGPQQQQQQQHPPGSIAQLTPSCSVSPASSVDGDLRMDLCAASSIGACSSATFLSASASSSRRHSLLSESGRASRRSSSFCDATPQVSSPTCEAAAAGAAAAEPDPSSSSALPSPAAAAEQPPAPWFARRWSFGVHHEQNGRKDMEDRLAAQDLSQHELFVNNCRRAGFFAVFDGHSGFEAAEYLSQHLLNYVLSEQDLLQAPEDALRRAVERAEEEIVCQFAEACCKAGSTLLAVLMVDDKLHIANVGDCRAVLAAGVEGTQLTRDHKPHCSEERRRIAAADPDADVTADGYIYGELAVARGIGSQHIKLDPSKRAFTHQPEMHTVQLREHDDFLLLASDGLWDKVHNGEAVTTARRSLATTRNAEACARSLVDRAMRQKSSDNISVVVLCLHDRAISLPKTNSRLFSRRQLGGDGTDSPRCNTPNSLGLLSAGTTPRSNTPVG